MTHFASGPKVKKREIPAEPRSSFRADIQGLRAVAVLIVVLYHAGSSWAPGGFVGVDVFFVISGFLITGSLLREIQKTGRISLVGFYGRRAARILPAATVTLVVVTILSYFMMPMTRWLQVGKDAMASGLYVINWVFAGEAVNYSSHDQAASPFKHFWSLAVEEQFYIFWPLLLVACSWIAVRYGSRRTVGFTIAFFVVGLPSFFWSIFLTSENPNVAYFVTTTRVWELVLGAGLAIFATVGWNTPRGVAALIGWLGLAAIFIAAYGFNDSTPFPSFTAALPALGAAMVIWAGPAAGRLGPLAVLGTRPMTAIGDMSYSLYLWHWPFLVLGGSLFGILSPVAGLIVVAVSLVPAWASLRYVERPFLVWAKAQTASSSSLRTGGLLTLSAVTVGALLAVAVPPVPPVSDIDFVATDVTSSDATSQAGAELLMDDLAHGLPKDSFPSVRPSAVAAPTDVPKTCLQPDLSEDLERCSFGNLESGTVLVMAGDSHAAMLVPGVAMAVAERGWRLDVYTKASCQLTSAVILLDGQPYESCSGWGQKVIDQVLKQRPAALIVATSRYTVTPQDPAVDNDAALVQGMRDAWEPIAGADIPIVSIRGMPRPGVLVPDCVSDNPTSLTNCAMPKTDILAQRAPEVEAVDGVQGAHALDLTDAICPGDMCPAVIGGVQIYRDSNHITATYARTMHGQIGIALDEVIAKK